MTRATSELLIEPSIIRNNISYLKSRIKSSSNFMAIIKSDSYGHLLNNVVQDIDDIVDGYGVVRLDEALSIRKISSKKILLMQGVYTDKDLKEAQQHSLDLVIHNKHQFNLIKSNKYYKNLWFKINTGMNRLGFEVDEFLDIYNTHLSDKEFTLMSHLSASNNPNDQSNKKQFERFNILTSKLHSNIKRSIANTGCVLNFPDKSFDWVRVGIGIFGGYIGNNDLKTAMTLRSPIIDIRTIQQGEGVGYDGRAVAKKQMKIATIYCGYADGLPHHIKDGTIVNINEQTARIFGKVSMDVCSVDVTDIPDCKIGDFCEFFSPNLSINNIASENNLISYDLMIRIKSRVKRIYRNI
jgi:alanine racemase|tara:strand:+ start:1209 stop:2267 length:1059 start_codon:yes stop_codon:yes gene_type:complete